MSPDFSEIGKWYKEEVGDDDGFDHQTFMAREYAGERALLDTSGKTERFSASIGASWYYAEETMTMEDRKPHLFHLVFLYSLTSISRCRPQQRHLLRRKWSLEFQWSPFSLQSTQDCAVEPFQAITCNSNFR